MKRKWLGEIDFEYWGKTKSPNKGHTMSYKYNTFGWGTSPLYNFVCPKTIIHIHLQKANQFPTFVCFGLLQLYHLILILISNNFKSSFNHYYSSPNVLILMMYISYLFIYFYNDLILYNFSKCHSSKVIK